MKSDVGIRKTTRQYHVDGWRQCSFQSVMKGDADIHKNLCADIVLSSGGNVSFQGVTNYDADTLENVLVSTDMSAVSVEVVVAKTSIEESLLQWIFCTPMSG